MAEAQPKPTHPRFQDLTGQRFGKLLVMSYAGMRGGREAHWNCTCDCGGTSITRGGRLRKGETKNCDDCGHPKHWMRGRPEYKIWTAMNHRCRNPRCASYPDYGGRGITVCERWQESFPAFIEDMGPRPSDQHSIDRIDNSKGYCPENCRWTTQTVQLNNTRRNVFITLNGKTLSVSQWSRVLGISKSSIYGRLKRGIPPESALANHPLSPQSSL